MQKKKKVEHRNASNLCSNFVPFARLRPFNPGGNTLRQLILSEMENLLRTNDAQRPPRFVADLYLLLWEEKSDL